MVGLLLEESWIQHENMIQQFNIVNIERGFNPSYSSTRKSSEPLLLQDWQANQRSKLPQSGHFSCTCTGQQGNLWQRSYFTACWIPVYSCHIAKKPSWICCLLSWFCCNNKLVPGWLRSHAWRGLMTNWERNYSSDLWIPIWWVRFFKCLSIMTLVVCPSESYPMGHGQSCFWFTRATAVSRTNVMPVDLLTSKWLESGKNVWDFTNVLNMPSVQPVPAFVPSYKMHMLPSRIMFQTSWLCFNCLNQKSRLQITGSVHSVPT